MPRIINLHDAKAHLQRLFDDAHAGEEIVLAKACKRYAWLVPLAPAQSERKLGRRRDRVAANVFDTLPPEELARRE